jgi:hypothetical protein
LAQVVLMLHQAAQQQPMDQIHRLAHLQQRVAVEVVEATAARMVVREDQGAAELLIAAQLVLEMLAAIHQSKAKTVVQAREVFPALEAVATQEPERHHQTQAQAEAAVTVQLIQSAVHQ